MTKEILRQIMDEHPKATRDELGKLYTAALRDDPDAAESVLLTVYAEMSVFDPERAAATIRLMKEDRSAGGEAFEALLKDMQIH